MAVSDRSVEKYLNVFQYWKEDFDHNNVPDRLHFQFTYESQADALKYLNIFLELDAYIEV